MPVLKKVAKLKPSLKPVREIGMVYSKPTRCLQCTGIVEMIHAEDADKEKGAWQCPRCNRKYLFAHWRIVRAGKKKSPAA